jgi:hypothetical protein
MKPILHYLMHFFPRETVLPRVALTKGPMEQNGKRVLRTIGVSAFLIQGAYTQNLRSSDSVTMPCVIAFSLHRIQ